MHAELDMPSIKNLIAEKRKKINDLHEKIVREKLYIGSFTVRIEPQGESDFIQDYQKLASIFRNTFNLDIQMIGFDRYNRRIVQVMNDLLVLSYIIIDDKFSFELISEPNIKIVERLVG